MDIILFYSRIVQGVASGRRLDLVNLEILLFHCLPNSALAGGNLAEVAWQGGKAVEHSNHSQPNPGL